MNETDNALIAALGLDARASLSDLAARLGGIPHNCAGSDRTAAPERRHPGF